MVCKCEKCRICQSHIALSMPLLYLPHLVRLVVWTKLFPVVEINILRGGTYTHSEGTDKHQSRLNITVKMDKMFYKSGE